MQNVTSDISADSFLTARQTRARYGGASDMWLHRRLHDDSGFPQPMVIGGRRFWRLSDLQEWERVLAEHSAKSPRPRRKGSHRLGDVPAKIVPELDR